MSGRPQLSWSAHCLLIVVAMNSVSTGKQDVIALHRAVSRRRDDVALGIVESLGLSVRRSRQLDAAAMELADSGFIEVEECGDMRVVGLPDVMPSLGDWRKARRDIGLELIT